MPFVKGHSGNPNGRPKKELSLTYLLEHLLDQKVTLEEYGKKRTVTGKEALAAQAIKLALAGDQTMIKFIYRQIDGDPNPTGSGNTSPLNIEIGGPEVLDNEPDNVEVFRGGP